MKRKGLFQFSNAKILFIVLFFTNLSYLFAFERRIRKFFLTKGAFLKKTLYIFKPKDGGMI